MLNKKSIFLILLTLTALLFLTLVFLLFKPSELNIIETFPENNAEQISLKPEINFFFNKNVNHEDFTYKIDPTVELEFSSSNKTLTLGPANALEYKTQYTLKIMSENLKEGEYTLIFMTKEDNELAREEGLEHAKAANALTKDLPLITKEYNIDYWAQKDTFIITMKWPPCDEGKQKIISWFSEKGFDYTKLKIVWTAEKGLPDNCYYE